jgi:hypothetical protein
LKRKGQQDLSITTSKDGLLILPEIASALTVLSLFGERMEKRGIESQGCFRLKEMHE